MSDCEGKAYGRDENVKMVQNIEVEKKEWKRRGKAREGKQRSSMCCLHLCPPEPDATSWVSLLGSTVGRIMIEELNSHLSKPSIQSNPTLLPPLLLCCAVWVVWSLPLPLSPSDASGAS